MRVEEKQVAVGKPDTPPGLPGKTLKDFAWSKRNAHRSSHSLAGGHNAFPAGKRALRGVTQTPAVPKAPVERTARIRRVLTLKRMPEQQTRHRL